MAKKEKKIEEKKVEEIEKEIDVIVEKAIEVVPEILIGGKKVIKVISETSTETLYKLEDGTTTFVEKA